MPGGLVCVVIQLKQSTFERKGMKSPEVTHVDLYVRQKINHKASYFKLNV